MKLIAILVSVFIFSISSAHAQSVNHTPQFNKELSDPDLIQVGHYKFRGRGGSDFPRRIKPPGERIFVFSPRYKAWAAYLSNGKRVGYGRANGGANWCADLGRPCRTPRGSFRIQSKGSPTCRSSRYPLPRGGAPMPYCMFFFSNYAIHGSPRISRYNSSHGCIRVQNRAAYWLSNYFMRIGTRVVVLPY